MSIKIFTLSFDDGVKQDKKLIDILDKYGIKATFNINYGKLGNTGKTTNKGLKRVDYSQFNKDEIVKVYANHEIGGHGLNHISLTSISLDQANYEISEDKKQLENIINTKVNIFAYPYGDYNDEIIGLLKKNGYKGARTVVSTYGFDFPKDNFTFNPTCHYNDPQLMKLAKDFVETKQDSLFYVWGHSYEFDQYDNYDVMENLCKYLYQYKDEILFLTNSDVYNKL